MFAGAIEAPALTANQPGPNDDTVAIRGLHEGYLLSGTTDVGSVVKLTATQTISGSETRKTERTAWVEGGNWYYAVQADDVENFLDTLSDDTQKFEFEVTAQDPLGGQNAPTRTQTINLRLNMTAPAVVFSGVFLDVASPSSSTELTSAVTATNVGAGDIVLKGTGSSAATIDILLPDGSLLAGDIDVDNAGNWSYTLSVGDFTTIGNGTTNLRFEANLNGNKKVVSQDLALAVVQPSAPNLTLINDDVATADYNTSDNNGLTLFGSYEPGATLDISYKVTDPSGDNTAYSVTATKTNEFTGEWTATLNPNLDNGQLEISMSSDKDNISSVINITNIIIDRTAPSAPTINVVNATAPRPILYGSTDADAYVTIYDGASDVIIASVLANSSGDWLWSPGDAWQDSPAKTIYAKVRDLAGNVSNKSSDTNFDPASGAVGLSLKPIGGDDSISAVDRTGDITVSGTTTAPTIYISMNGTDTVQTANLGQKLSGFTVDGGNAGTGFTENEALIFTDSDGNVLNASGTASEVDGNDGLVSIALTSGGSGYLADLTNIVVTSAGGGTGAVASASLSTEAQAYSVVLSDALRSSFGRVESISLASGGTGYNSGSLPNVILSAPTDTSSVKVTATADAIVDSDGLITGFTITNPGSGYVSAPTVAIDAPGGTGTQAVATSQLYESAVLTVLEAVSDNEQQKITVTDAGGGATPSGTYSTSLRLDGTAFTSSTINYDEEAAGMLTALLAMEIPGADFDVTKSGSEYTIEFKGSLKDRNVDLLQLNASLTNASVAVTEEAAGTSSSAISRVVTWDTSSAGTFDSSSTTPLTVSSITKSGISSAAQLTGNGVPFDTLALKLEASDGSISTLATTTINAGGEFNFVLDGLSLNAGSKLYVTSTNDGAVSGNIVYDPAAPEFSVKAVAADDLVTVSEIDRIIELRGTAGLDVETISLDFAGLEDVDGISETQSGTANDALSIDGDLATGGSVTNTVAQQVSVTSSGDDSLVTFAIVGTDADGGSQTVTLTGAAIGTVTSSETFLTVTSITPNSNTLGAVTVGVKGTITISPSQSVHGEIVAGDGSMEWRLKIPKSALPDLNNVNQTLTYTVSNDTETTSLQRDVRFAITQPVSTPVFLDSGADQLRTLAVTEVQPSLSGNAALPNATVNVYNKTKYDLIASTTAGSDGAWSISSSDYVKALSEGSFNLVAISVDEYGNYGSAPDGNELAVTISLGGVTAPTLVGIDNNTGRPDDNITSATEPIIRGFADAGAIVQVSVGGVAEASTATVNELGQWTYTLATKAAGAHTISAVAVLNSVTSAASSNFVINIDNVVSTPSIDDPETSYANPQPIISGGAEAGTVVRLYRLVGSDETLLGEAVAVADTAYGAGGSWRITPTSSLPDGDNIVIARAIDNAGNQSVASGQETLAIQAATPNLSVSRVAGDNVVTLTDVANGAFVSGYAEPGSSVSVRIAANDRSATIDSNGRWSYQITDDDRKAVGIADNVIIRATALSPSGNATVAQQTVNFRTEQAAIPTSPTISSGNIVTSAGQAGSVFGKGQINANALVIESAKDIDVRSNVTTATLIASGTDMFLSNAGALELNAQLNSGEMAIRAGGTMVIHDASFVTDTNGNLMEFMSGDSGLWAGEEDALRKRLGNVGLNATQIDTQVARHNFILDNNGQGLTGGVLIDRINAGSLGDVIVKTSGDVREVLKDDGVDILFDLAAYAPGGALGPSSSYDRTDAIDVIAGSFVANGRNRAGSSVVANIVAVSQLEFSDALLTAQSSDASKISLEWATMSGQLVVDSNTSGFRDNVYALAGYFSTAVDVELLNGTIDIVGLYTNTGGGTGGSVTLSAKEVTIAGTVRSQGAVSVTGGADGVIIKEGAYIASEGGQAVSIATANGSDIVMGAGSTVKTTGNVAITSDTGNISLSRIVSADPSLDYDGNSLVTTSGGVTVSTAGKITDGESGSVASVETANIETLGSISLTAGGGIGTTSDSFVIKSNTINSLVSGSGNISVDLQKLSGSNITINEISAHDVDLSAKTAIVIGSSSSSAGMTVSGDLAIALESGTLTQNAAIASAGTVTLDMAADTILENTANNFNVVAIDSSANVRINDANAITVSGDVSQGLTVSAGTTMTLGDIDVGANLAISSSGGAITGGGTVTVTGTSVLGTGTGHNISLTGNNDFSDTVTLSGGGITTLSDINSLKIAGTNASALSLDVGGAVAVGAITVGTSGQAADLSVKSIAGISDVTGAITIYGASNLSAGQDADGITKIQSGTANTALSINGDLATGGSVTNTVAQQVSVTSTGNDTGVTFTIVGTNAVGASQTATLTGAAIGTVATTETFLTVTSITPNVDTVGMVTAGTASDIKLDTARHRFFGNVTATAKDITLTADGDVGLSAQASNDVSVDVASGGLNLFNSNIDGNLTADAVGADVGNNVVSGSIDFTSTGAITSSGKLEVGLTSTISASGQTVTLNNAENDFVGAVTITAANNLTISDKNSMTFGGAVSDQLILNTGAELIFGALALGGDNPSITAQTISAGGKISQTNSTSFVAHGNVTIDSLENDIVLKNSGNDFTGSLTVENGKTLEITDANDLNLGATSVSGDVSIGVSGTLDQSTVAGKGLAIGGDFTVDLGDGAGSGDDLSLLNAGNSIDGDMTILGADQVSITTKTALHIVEAEVANNLILNSEGRLYNANGWDVAGTTVINAAGQDVVLTAAHDFKNSVSITARSLTINDVNDIVFDSITLTGNLKVTAAGSITATGTVKVDGRTELIAGGSSSDIVFNNVNNDFIGSVSVSNVRDVSLKDKNSMVLGQQAISGNLSATAVSGVVSDSAAINVTGTTEIVAGTNISLNAAGHDFVGAVSMTGADSTLRDGNALTLGSVDLSGAMTLYAQGTVTGTSVIEVDLASLVNAGGNDINLGNTQNDFVGLLTLEQAKNITIVDKNALAFSGNAAGIGSDLILTAGGALELSHGVSSVDDITLVANGISFGQSTVGGDLVVNATGGGGAITQRQQTLDGIQHDSILRISGASNITADAITLDHVNAFNGNVLVSSTGNVNLNAEGAIAFAGATVGGNLIVSSAKSITQTGALSVTGTTSLNATAYDADITLSHVNNDFQEIVTILDSRDLTISDENNLSITGSVSRDWTLAVSGALSVGALEVGDDLTVAAGSITDSGSYIVDVESTSTLEAGGAITLDNLHSFGGAVDIKATGDVSLRDTNALLFSRVDISGSLVLQADGSITQKTNSVVGVVGTADIRTNSSSSVILTESNNNFQDSVSFAATKSVSIVDVDGFKIDGSIGDGGLEIAAGGLVSFGATSVMGAVVVDAVGDVDQSGALSFADTTKLKATGTVVLNNVANDFSGNVKFSVGGDASLTDTNTLLSDGAVVGALTLNSGGGTSLGTLTVSDDLNVTAAGDIGQINGATLKVVGDTSVAASDGTTDYKVLFDNRVSNTVSLNEFVGNVNISAAAEVKVRAIGTLSLAVNSSGNVDVFADDKLYLLGTNITGTLNAAGNFDLSGDIVAEFVDFYSDSYLNMNGYAITATGAGSTGSINVIAEGDIKLGRVSSQQSGNIFIESKSGSVSDGLLTTGLATNTLWNIKTSGAVSILANAGDLNLALHSSAYTGNAETADTSVDVIDIVAVLIDRLEAPDNIEMTVDANVAEVSFLGDVTALKEVNFNLGSADLVMAGNTKISASSDINITTDGSMTLSKLTADDGKTINLNIGGDLVGQVNADGTANLSGSKIRLDVIGSIGTSSQVVTMDAQTTDQSTNGAIEVISTSSDAYVSVVTQDVGNDRQTVELGTASQDWVIGSSLNVTATDVDLSILGNITASDISIVANRGAISMAEAKTIASDGTITLSGSAGLAVSNIVGDTNTTSGADQTIVLSSNLGNISENTSTENANILTAGELRLIGQSIGVFGSGDLDVNVGRMDIATTSNKAGVANIESLSSSTLVEGSSVTGVLTLTVDQGDLTLSGDLSAGGIMFNLADSSAGSELRDLIVNDGVSLSSLGAATILTTGDVLISDINIATGNLSIIAGGSVTDKSVGETPNITMGSGELSIDAASIDLDVDVSNIKSLSSTSTDETSTTITVNSIGSATNLGDIFATGGVVFQQTQGNLNLTGTVFVDNLDIDVLAGSLSQQESASLTVSNDFNLVSSSDMALSSITSQNGSIALVSGGALLDASPTRETALITTNNSDATVSISATNIGIASEIGEIEISSNNVNEIIATSGGAYVEVMLSADLGKTSVFGDMVFKQTRGDLMLTDQVVSTAGDVTISAAGNLKMGTFSSITARDGANLLAMEGDLELTSVLVTGTGPDTAISSMSASGNILDVNPWIDGPSLSDVDGWNVSANGILSLSADNIGQLSQRVNIRSADISNILATGEAFIAGAGMGSGDVSLGGGSATDGVFDLNMLSENLIITGSIEAKAVSVIVDSGSLTLTDGISVVAYNDMDLIAQGDINLSSIQTSDGVITIDAKAGRVLDNTNAEISNITVLSDEAVVNIFGISIGEKDIVDGENVSDIDLSISKIGSMIAGSGGIYLDSARTLDVGDVVTSGDLDVRITSGDLIFSSDQTVVSASLEVKQGSLRQVSGTTLETTGVSGSANSGDLDINVMRDVTFSTMLVNSGNVTLVSELGSVLDGTLADTASLENLVIHNGQLVEMSATQIGTHYEGGDINIDALDINSITAFEGGIFIGLTGRDEALTIIDTLTAIAEQSDVLITSGAGMLQVNNANASDNLSLRAAGESGQDSLLVGTARAGGNLALSSTVGNITQIENTDIIANSLGSVTELSSGGDIILVSATNDFDELSVDSSKNLSARDISNLKVFNINAVGNLSLTTAKQISLQDDTSITVGGDAVISVSTGSLIFGENHVTNVEGNLTADVFNGDWVAISSSTITVGKDIDTAVIGNVDLQGVTSVTAGGSIDITADNSITMNGATTVSAVSGKLSLVSMIGGDLVMSGVTNLDSGKSTHIELAVGNMIASDATSSLADDGALDIILHNGELRLNGTSSLQGNSVDISLDTQDRSVTFTGNTEIIGDTGSVNVQLSDGDMTISGVTTVLAALDVLVDITNSGLIRMSGVTNVTAEEGNVAISTDVGDLSFSDKTTFTSGNDTVLSSNIGDLTTVSATTLNAERDILITLEDGFANLSDKTVLDAVRNVVINAYDGFSGSELSHLRGENVRVSTTDGAITLNDSTLFAAASDLTIFIDNGLMVMEDAETLIKAHDVKITVNYGFTEGEGSISIDRIEAEGTAWLQAFDGAILDNTESEDIDIIDAHVLSMEASDGIGIDWEDDLDTNADFISAVNSRSGGINIQNRSGLAVGNDSALLGSPTGIVNTGDGDLILISLGEIKTELTSYGYGDPYSDGSVSNLLRQKIFVVHNLSVTFFNDHWGNTTSQRLSAQTRAPDIRGTEESEQTQRVTSDVAKVLDLTELNNFGKDGDAFKALESRLNVQQFGDDTRSIVKSRDLLNIASGPLIVESQGLKLERMNQIEKEQTEDADMDAPLIPNEVDLFSQNINNDENISERPVLSSAIELADDNLYASLIAAE